MWCRVWFLCAVLAACGAKKATEAEKKKSKLCEKLFEEEALECATCDFIEKTRPELQGLVADCRQCCHGAAERFASAAFEIDERYLAWNPEMRDFVDKHADSISSLKVKYVEQRRASLRLQRADGTEDKVAVQGWKADVLRDFLVAKLVQSDK